jgi:hypothetical protein
MAFTPGTRAVISFVVDGVQAAQRQISSVSNSMSGLGSAAHTSLKELAAFAGVGLGLGALAQQVITAQREFDKLNGSLVTATGSSENAAVAFKALEAFASTTPFDLKQTTEAFVQLRNLGLTPSERALTSFGNTASSKSKQLSDVVEAVADAATGSFERLKEAFGVTATQMGDNVALSFQGSTAVIAKDAKEIQEYLIKIGEVQFGGAMSRQINTLDGAVSNLGDTWQSAMRTIASNGVGDEATSGVLAMVGALNDLSAILNVVGGAAHKQGEQVKEASILHQGLTAIFETLAVTGVNVAYVFSTIGKDIGAMVAQFTILTSGGLKGLIDGSTKKAVQELGNARVAEAEQERKAVDEKSAAIIGASTKAAAAQEKAAAARKASGKDELEQFGIILTAEQKRSAAKLALVPIEEKITGVTAASLAELKKVQTAYDTGAITLARYNFLKGKLTEAMYQNSAAGKEEAQALDRAGASLKQRADMVAVVNERELARIAFLRQINQLTEEEAASQSGAIELKVMADQKKELADQLALAKRKKDGQKEQIELLGQIAVAGAKMRSKEIEQQQKLEVIERERYLLAANNYADVIEQAAGEAKVQQDALRDQKDANAQLGMTEKQMAAVTSQRLLDMAARADENALIAEGVDWSGRLSQAYRDQAEALRGRAAAATNGAELKQQKEMWATIETTAHDTFVSIFDSGKSTFDRLRDTLKNGLLDLLYQMTVKKWIMSISASVGVGGMSGLAQGATGVADGASSAGGLVGAAQTAAGLYKAITGGFTAVGASIGGMVSTVGNVLGSSSISAFGAGMGMTGGQAAAASSAYGAAGMQGTGSAISAGSTAGAFAGIAAGVMGGVMGGRLISGQYGSNTTVNAGTAIGAVVGSVVPVIGTAIGALVGGLLGGVGNRLFGMGDKNVTATGMAGTVSDSGLTGASYQKWSQKGGVFRSDKSGTDKTAFDAELSKQFVNGFATIKSASAGFAASIGASTSSLAGYSKTFDIALTKDAAANEKAVTDFFTGVGDEIALRLVPGLAQFSKSGEAMSTTLQRLAGDFEATNQVAMLMGKNGTTMFGSLGVDSAAARERLIDLAGGVSTLSTQAASFAQNYMTEAQRLAPVAEAVSTAMASLGLASVTTRDQFAARVNQLINSGAILQQAGAQEYTSLMALADAFAQVHPAIEGTTAAAKTAAEVLTERADLQKQYDQLTMSSTQLLAQQRDALDASNRGLFDQVQAAQAAKTANDAAKASMGEFLNSTKSFAESVKGFNGDLMTGSLSTLTPEQQYAEARRQFEQTRAAAATGDTAAQGNLKAIENTFLTLSQKINGGDTQYSSDLASVMRTNDELAQWSAASVDVAQASLDAMNAQVSGIATLNATMWTVAQNLQYLPVMTGAAAAPTFTPVALPNIDYSSYGTASQAPLLAEIKALREEVKAFRADAQQQTADKIVVAGKAAMAAADRIVEGVGDAIDEAMNDISSNKVDLSDF